MIERSNLDATREATTNGVNQDEPRPGSQPARPAPGIASGLRGSLDSHSLSPANLMVATVQRALRVLLVLALWVGVGLSAASTPAADVAPRGLGADNAGPWLVLLDRLGGSRICGDEEGVDEDIFCGGELLLDGVVDPSVLAMSRGTCTRLFEELFGAPTCDPALEECDEWCPRGAVPPPRGASAATPSSVAALDERARAMQRDYEALAARRPESDRLPSSFIPSLLAPPPRALASLA